MTSHSINAIVFSIILLLHVKPLFGDNHVDKRFASAVAALDEAAKSPDSVVFRSVLSRAKCIIVIPNVKKVAFVVGLGYGKGFLSCRDGSKERWASPLGIRLIRGGAGLQVGGAVMDLFILLMTQPRSAEVLRHGLALGGEAMIATGPLGRGAMAATDDALRAEMLSWSRSRGVFAGVSLEGASVRLDNGATSYLQRDRQEWTSICVDEDTDYAQAFAAAIERCSGRQ